MPFTAPTSRTRPKGFRRRGLRGWRLRIEEVNPTHRKAVADVRLEPAPGKRLEEQLPPEITEAVGANYRASSRPAT
jgi:hypothetical protein